MTERFTFRGARSYTHFAKELRVSVNTVKSAWYRSILRRNANISEANLPVFTLGDEPSKTRNFRREISVPSIRFEAEMAIFKHTGSSFSTTYSPSSFHKVNQTP